MVSLKKWWQNEYAADIIPSNGAVPTWSVATQQWIPVIPGTITPELPTVAPFAFTTTPGNTETLTPQVGQTTPTLLLNDQSGDQFFAAGSGVDDPTTVNGWVFGSLLNVGLEDYYSVQQAIDGLGKVSRWYVENEADASDYYGLIEMGLDGIKQFRYLVQNSPAQSTLTLTGITAQTAAILDIITQAGAHALRVTGDNKVGLFDAAPVGKAGAYTQTYATAARVNPNATALAVLTTGAGLASYGYTQAQADSIPVAINAIEADLLAIKKLVNALIDDSQALGVAA